MYTHTHMWLTMILSTRDLKYNDMVSKPIKVPRSAMQCGYTHYLQIIIQFHNTHIYCIYICRNYIHRSIVINVIKLHILYIVLHVIAANIIILHHHQCYYVYAH